MVTIDGAITVADEFPPGGVDVEFEDGVVADGGVVAGGGEVGGEGGEAVGDSG